MGLKPRLSNSGNWSRNSFLSTRRQAECRGAPTLVHVNATAATVRSALPFAKDSVRYPSWAVVN